MHGLPALMAQGLPVLVEQAVLYLRQMFSDHVFSGAQVGVLSSGLKRFVGLSRALGMTMPDPGEAFRPLWKIHRSWVSSVPSELR